MNTTQPSLRLETVTASIDGEVGEFLLRRPHALNACSVQLMRDVIEAALWFDTHEGVKAVVLRGEGKAFCAGFDLKLFLGSGPEEVREAVELGRKMIQTVEDMRAFTISAVHGNCVGGGLVLAGACDFRYADEGARFHLPEVDLGVPLAWGGIPRLIREVGTAATLELAVLCRPMTAEMLLGAGFLNEVLPEGRVLAHARGIAAEIAQKPNLVLKATKRQLLAARDALASTSHAFADAFLFYSAVTDDEATRKRRAYVEALKKRA